MVAGIGQGTDNINAQSAISTAAIEVHLLLLLSCLEQVEKLTIEVFCTSRRLSGIHTLHRKAQGLLYGAK